MTARRGGRTGRGAEAQANLRSQPPLSACTLCGRVSGLSERAVELCEQALGCASRRWAVRAGVGLCAQALGCASKRWAVRADVGLCEQALGCASKRWTMQYASKRCGSLCGPTPGGGVSRGDLCALWAGRVGLCELAWSSVGGPCSRDKASLLSGNGLYGGAERV